MPVAFEAPTFMGLRGRRLRFSLPTLCRPVANRGFMIGSQRLMSLVSDNRMAAFADPFAICDADVGRRTGASVFFAGLAEGL